MTGEPLYAPKYKIVRPIVRGDKTTDDSIARLTDMVFSQLQPGWRFVPLHSTNAKFREESQKISEAIVGEDDSPDANAAGDEEADSSTLLYVTSLTLEKVQEEGLGIPSVKTSNLAILIARLTDTPDTAPEADSIGQGRVSAATFILGIIAKTQVDEQVSALSFIGGHMASVSDAPYPILLGAPIITEIQRAA